MARTKGAIAKDRKINADGLREILKPIFDELERKGVPPVRMPSPDHIVSKLTEWFDPGSKQVKDWVEGYAKLEGPKK